MNLDQENAHPAGGTVGDGSVPSMPPGPPPPRGGGGPDLRGPWGALFLFLLIFVLFLLGGAALGGLEGGIALDRALAFFSQVGFVLLPTLLVVRWSGADPIRALRLRGLGPVGLAAAVVMTVSSLPLLSALTVFLSRLPLESQALERQIRDLIRADGAWELVGVLLLAAVLPSICEELLFRGWILSALSRGMGTNGALAIQAVLFGLLHAHPVRVVPMTLLGLLLGWLTLRTGSILAPIMGHAVYNGLIVLAAQQAPLSEGSPASLGWNDLGVILGSLVVLALGLRVLTLRYPPKAKRS